MRSSRLASTVVFRSSTKDPPCRPPVVKSPLTLVVQPPLDKKDLKKIRDESAYYQEKLDQDSGALIGGDFEHLLKTVWKLLEQVDFQQKEIPARNAKVACKILDTLFLTNG
jgi:hypothetical protein